MVHRDYLVIIGFIEASVRAAVSAVPEIRALEIKPGQAFMMTAVQLLDTS